MTPDIRPQLPGCSIGWITRHIRTEGRRGWATTGSSQAASRGEVVLTLTAILVQLEDHDIRALILGMGRVVAVSRRIPVLAEATTDLHDLNGRPGWLRFSIRTTAWESRLMKDAVTIVVVHTSRQHGQSLLNVD